MGYPVHVANPQIYLVRKDKPPDNSSPQSSTPSGNWKNTSPPMSVVSKLQILMFYRPSAVVLLESQLDRMLADVTENDAATDAGFFG
jgi:hypothetical protein